MYFTLYSIFCIFILFPAQNVKKQNPKSRTTEIQDPWKSQKEQRSKADF